MNRWKMSDEIEKLEKSQREMLGIKCMVVDLKNSCDVIISRKDTANKRINKFEYTSTEIIQTISQREKERKKQRIQYPGDNIKWPNIHVIGITEGERDRK